MLRIALMLSVGMVMPAMSGDVPRPMDAVRRLASEPPEVARAYDRLSAQSPAERRRAYGELSSSMKAALWSHQLLLALSQHSEFADEQRAVLYDALDLFTPALFDGLKPDVLHDIEQRARAAFEPALAARLFAQLGGWNSPPAETGDEAWPADAAVSENEAAQAYATLVAQSAGERRRSYGAMPGSMRAALWMHQLRSALRTRSDLTTAQRSVIRRTLILLKAGVPEMDARLHDLAAQARAEFGDKAARDLFAELGPRDVDVQPDPASALHRPRPADFPTCTCNTASDFCGSRATCWQAGGCYFTSLGCGFLWNYSCIGLCQPNSSGG